MPDGYTSGAEASAILSEAADIVRGARNGTHGDKERSFALIARLWSEYLAARREGAGAGVQGIHVAQMMEMLKIARSISGAPVRDHFLDAAGYAAIAGELAATTTVGVAWADPTEEEMTDTELMELAMEAEEAREDEMDRRAAAAQPASRPFTFWYIATPYARYQAGHTAANTLACRCAAQLMQSGFPVFSPIAHSHAIALFGALPKTDHDFWMSVDAPLMDAASGLVVVMAEGWQESRGMAEEISRFTQARKPVVYWAPSGPPPTTILLERMMGRGR